MKAPVVVSFSATPISAIPGHCQELSLRRRSSDCRAVQGTHSHLHELPKADGGGLKTSHLVLTQSGSIPNRFFGHHTPSLVILPPQQVCGELV
jgi:hypothetical protein